MCCPLAVTARPVSNGTTVSFLPGTWNTISSAATPKSSSALASMVTSSSGVTCLSPPGRITRTSGGQSFSMRMKYSVSPGLSSPSTSVSATRYEPSARIGIDAVSTCAPLPSGSVLPSAMVMAPRATGLSVVTVSSTVVPAGP